MLTLVLGGARSGKSRVAQDIVETQSKRRVFIATAEPFDAEMRTRIAKHRAERDTGWRTLEEPVNLIGAIEKTRPDEALLIDCLTLWISNLLGRSEDLETHLERLSAYLGQVGNPVTMVSNEVGLGLVPETRLGREFRDAQGRTNQSLAAQCDRVAFVAAGLPIWLKGAPFATGLVS